MGSGRSSLPHSALPAPSVYRLPDLRARRGERGLAIDSRRVSLAWEDNISAGALRVSVRSLTYALFPGKRSRKGVLSRVL